jgi:hypothetical protein
MRNITAMYAGNGTTITVDKHPFECGICHKNVDPKFISGVYVKGDKNSALSVEATFQCTNAECTSLIIGYYERGTDGYFYLTKNAPIIPRGKEFNLEIDEVSPNFVQIYNQSSYAEQNGLSLISGIGYRKAIEFLIKDYLIFLFKDEEDSIKKLPLSQCINKMDNHDIKEIAKRATWIGNDEAHYTRKWEDKDINDLKRLIDVTVYFISMNITAKKYLQEMS